MRFSYLSQGMHPYWGANVTRDEVLLERWDEKTGVTVTLAFAVPMPELPVGERLQAFSDRGLKALRQLEAWAGGLDDLAACQAAYAANQKGIWWAELEAPLPLARFFECGQPHHVTLLYKVTYGEGAALEGTVHEFATTELCRNERVEALRVTVPAGLPCNKKQPHVTVSWLPDVAPAASNEMLDAPTHVQPHAQRFQARVKWKPHWV